MANLPLQPAKELDIPLEEAEMRWILNVTADPKHADEIDGHTGGTYCWAHKEAKLLGTLGFESWSKKVDRRGYTIVVDDILK